MAIEITQQEIVALKKQGYTDQMIQEALAKMEERELRNSYSDSYDEEDPIQESQHSSFMTRPEENLIKWQLELNDILERAEHILRGDVPTYKRGVLIWEKNDDPKQNPLNKQGIQEVMKILAMYINRNTILSDYNNDEINYKVFDFGREINNFIFMIYDEIGLDTEQKRKSYGLIVRELVDLVHSAYKRALHGGERRSLREMIQVSQTGQLQGFPGQGMQSQQPRERSILNPMRFIKGKYV